MSAGPVHIFKPPQRVHLPAYHDEPALVVTANDWSPAVKLDIGGQITVVDMDLLIQALEKCQPGCLKRYERVA